MLASGEHVVWVQNTACREDFKLELGTGVHNKIELDRAVKHNDKFISNLLIDIFIHVIKDAAFLFDLSITNIGELDKDLFTCLRKIVNLAESRHQE